MRVGDRAIFNRPSAPQYSGYINLIFCALISFKTKSFDYCLSS